MTRDEFKASLGGLIDETVKENRELTEADIDELNDVIGEVTNTIVEDSDDDSEEGEKSA